MSYDDFLTGIFKSNNNCFAIFVANIVGIFGSYLNYRLSILPREPINSGNNQIISVLKVFVWTMNMQLPGKNNHTKEAVIY